ncbi:hypothetical protein SAMN05444358_101138 [Ruegeria halocynthiae]|uniref:Uncharacterized protein n=1 Tax=Ruegeria halocynthiae TaxID=985054 RepID=A0A1H2RFF6_9RHOB|nr:hypothetical protein [Ruegeria halocynthiae]SDW17910.1 hypothetical protein SAMN05444358_101138 [Ruegeria halocynthiae]
MTQQLDTPIEFAKEFIKPRVMWSKHDWFGPVAYVLTNELGISIDKLQWDYDRSDIEQVHHGKQWSIPADNLPVLLRVAPWHREAFKLACELSSDYLEGESKLPSEMREFISGVLRRDIRFPDKVGYDKHDLKRPETFLRDRAIYDTAEAVSDQFGLPPTGSSSATEVAVQALNAVRQELEKAGLVVMISTNISAGAAVAQRYKMPTYAELNERVTAMLKLRMNGLK